MSKEQNDAQKLARLFEARAKDLASPREVQKEREFLFHVALVQLDKYTIGFPIDHVRELLKPPPIAPLFGMPNWFSGVVCLHAQIVSVIDLGQWLGIGARGPKNCLIILGGPEGDIGVLSDNCIGFRSIHSDDIDSAIAPSHPSALPSTLHVTHDFCTILNVPKLIGDPRLRFGSHAPGLPDHEAPR